MQNGKSARAKLFANSLGNVLACVLLAQMLASPGMGVEGVASNP